MKKGIILVAAAVAALSITSCEKAGVAPTPPSASTVSLDFTAFDQNTTKAEVSEPVDEFFTFASTQVISQWRTIFEQIASIPVNAYELVISSTPVESGKGYVWTVRYTDAANQTYTVELYGEDKGRRTNWELRVSKDGLLGYSDFTWITGWATKDGREGQWNVKVSPIDTDVVVTIDWKMNENEVRYAKVTYCLDHLCCGISPFFNNSWIEYRSEATDSAYNASFTAYYSQMADLWVSVNIEWNEETGAGRVKCEGFFGNTNWHCWTPTHSDVE